MALELNIQDLVDYINSIDFTDVNSIVIQNELNDSNRNEMLSSVPYELNFIKHDYEQYKFAYLYLNKNLKLVGEVTSPIVLKKANALTNFEIDFCNNSLLYKLNQDSTIPIIDCSEITKLDYLFSNLKRLDKFSITNKASNFKNLTSIKGMFKNLKSKTFWLDFSLKEEKEILELNCDELFENSEFNFDINGYNQEKYLNFNFFKILSAENMFKNKKILILPKITVSENCKNFKGMFSGSTICSQGVREIFENLNTENCDFSYCFENTECLDYIDCSFVGKNSNINYMFRNSKVKMVYFPDTLKLTSSEGVCEECYDLVNLHLIKDKKMNAINYIKNIINNINVRTMTKAMMYSNPNIIIAEDVKDLNKLVLEELNAI